MVKRIPLFFSEHFRVERSTVEGYGAFDINLASDLPLFIDPFLLFNSSKPEYQDLHEGIIDYLRYLKELSREHQSPPMIRYLYRFQEVRQNWFGFSFMGNRGHGLGARFATDLHDALGRVLRNFGEEGVTRGSHLEKVRLIRPNVGRDSISDFTTNLIKHYLVEFTEQFARKHLRVEDCATVAVERIRFNFDNGSWMTEQRYLPYRNGDYILLTPMDMLTRDETWINYPDMVNQYPHIASAVEDDIARDRIDRYFQSRLGEKPSSEDVVRARRETLQRFPELLDLYIRIKEDSGDEAAAISQARRDELRRTFVTMLDEFRVGFANLLGDRLSPRGSFEDAMHLVHVFKSYVEDNDGYRLLNRDGHFSSEKDLQLFMGLVFQQTEFDVNREVNNGRGPVDFKVSKGSADKSLIEVKLASNKQLERNLQNQLRVYEAANRTHSSISVIVYYTESEKDKVDRILKRLGRLEDPYIVLINARADDKPSGSKA